MAVDLRRRDRARRQSECSAVSILDQPFPGLGGVSFRTDSYRLLFKIDISPCAIQQLSSSQTSREGNDNQQGPPQTSLIIGLFGEILGRFQNTFAFIIAVDIDLILSGLWHLDISEQILIKLITRNSGIEDALDLSELLLDRSRTVTLVQTALTIVLSLAQRNSPVVEIADHSDEIFHRRAVFLVSALSDLITSPPQAVLHEIPEFHRAGLNDSYYQLTLELCPLTFGPATICMT